MGLNTMFKNLINLSCIHDLTLKKREEKENQKNYGTRLILAPYTRVTCLASCF